MEKSKTARLLIVTTVASTLQAFLMPFAEHFRKLGWQVDAVANGVSSSGEWQGAFDHVWDIGWSRQPLDMRNLAGPTKQLRRLVQEQHYNIVHVHTPVAAFVTRYALRKLRARDEGPKVIYTAHGFHFYEDEQGLHNRVFLLAEKLAGHWTDYLVVINRKDETAARNYHIVPEGRIIYMPGIGVDTKRYDPEKVHDSEVASVRKELGLSPHDKLFLMIAEFNPGKRHCDAVQALAILRNNTATLRDPAVAGRDHGNDGSKVHMAFAGDGPLLDKTRQLAGRLGIASQVHFLGLRHDIPALIRSSAAVLLPSAREGLSRSIMESLSLGVPVIGTDIRGTRDLLQNEAGLLVPVGRPDELARAMSWIVEHPVEATRIGQIGRTKMAAYDLGQIISLHEQLYAQALRKSDMPTQAKAGSSLNIRY